MSESNNGKIVWHDLTIDNASAVRDFYKNVVGWSHSEIEMGDYSDFVMESNGEGVCGVCHARGSNTGMPAQWLIYVQVEDIENSAKECVKNGGEVVHGPRDMGGMVFCVVKDPAGAVLGLIQGQSD